MTVTLACTADVWSLMVEQLSCPLETAGALVCGVAADKRDVTLLATEVHLAPETDYMVREEDGLVLASHAYVPVLKRAADTRRVAVFFHTHPGGRPAPSKRDAVVDGQLRDLFGVRTRSGRYASVILGGSAAEPLFSGRWFGVESESLPIDRVRVVGSRLRVQRQWLPGAEASVGHVYDRQVRAFGQLGQQILGDLRVGVVGAGGTGSAVVEQLARLGIGSLVLVDDDRVTATNITRIYGSRQEDEGIPKVDVLSNHASEIGLGTAVETHATTVNNLTGMASLRHCDVVFGCTDDHRGRAVLSRLAYWYLLPVIDMGFVITSTDGEVSGLFGRVTTAGPGMPCLVCRGRVDANRMREESLDPQERARLVAEGYAQGLDEPDPAVITYTTLVASLAVNELLSRLFGFGEDPAPTELLVRAHERTINRLSGHSRPDHYCVDPAALGSGDVDPPLGMLWI